MVYSFLCVKVPGCLGGTALRGSPQVQPQLHSHRLVKSTVALAMLNVALADSHSCTRFQRDECSWLYM